MTDSNRGGTVTTDVELQAMNILVKAHKEAMALLDDGDRKRVTDWYFDRFIGVGGAAPVARMAGQPDKQLGSSDGRAVEAHP
jgi:hypothetical protein